MLLLAFVIASLRSPLRGSRRSALLAVSLCSALTFVIRPSANAAVIYSGLQNIPIPTTFDGIYLDIDTGATSTSPSTGWDLNFFFGGLGIGGLGIGGSEAFQPARTGTGNMDTILLFGVDDVIGSSLFYSTGETGSSDHLGNPGNFQDGVEGYLGFRFTKNDLSGPFYGYMRLTLTANTPGAHIHDWAWDDTTPAAPSPSRNPAAHCSLSSAYGLRWLVEGGKKRRASEKMKRPHGSRHSPLQIGP